MAERSRLRSAVFGTPLATASASGWAYPVPPFSRAIRILRVALGWALLGGGGLALTLGVLWAIPAAQAANSAAYALVKARANSDRELPPHIGSPLECERVPTHFRFDEDRASFRFWIRGPRGRAQVSAQVEVNQATRLSVIRIRFGSD